MELGIQNQRAEAMSSIREGLRRRQQAGYGEDGMVRRIYALTLSRQSTVVRFSSQRSIKQEFASVVRGIGGEGEGALPVLRSARR